MRGLGLNAGDAMPGAWGGETDIAYEPGAWDILLRSEKAATDVMSGRIAVFLPTLGGHIGNVAAGRMRARVCARSGASGTPGSARRSPKAWQRARMCKSGKRYRAGHVDAESFATNWGNGPGDR